MSAAREHAATPPTPAILFRRTRTNGRTDERRGVICVNVSVNCGETTTIRSTRTRQLMPHHQRTVSGSYRRNQ